MVVLCDISGSMERHSRLLLRFVQALSSASEVRAESFVFGTRLTRVTRLLRDKDRDRALARVSETVNDWAGGTRIGESFRTFNQQWARRSLRSSGVVVVVSDGWDRGDPALVASETARLRRNCHRLVWLNPLAGTPGYQPLAGGMRAAFPYIDDFLPAGTVASLERLGEILGGVRSADTRHGAEAAAHAALPEAAALDRRVAGDQPNLVAQPDEAALDQLDRLHHDRRRARSVRGVDRGQDPRPNGGMDDRLEIAEVGRIVEHDPCQRAAIDRAVGRSNVGPEAVGDRPANRLVPVDRADMPVRRKHCDHRIACPHRVGGGSCGHAPRSDRGAHGLLRQIVGVYEVARPDEAGGHAPAHGAQTYKGYLSHNLSYINILFRLLELQHELIRVAPFNFCGRQGMIVRGALQGVTLIDQFEAGGLRFPPDNGGINAVHGVHGL